MAIHGDVRERCSSFLSLEQFAFSLLEKWTGLGLREVNSKNQSSSVVPPPYDTGSNSTSQRIQQGKRRKARATRSIAYSRWRNLGVAGWSTSPPWTICFSSFWLALIWHSFSFLCSFLNFSPASDKNRFRSMEKIFSGRSPFSLSLHRSNASAKSGQE